MPFPFLAPDVSPNPAVAVADVTPSNTVDLARAPCRALWIGVLGDVAVVMLDGSTATLVGAQGLLPVSVKRVALTGTTATSIVALY